MTTTTDTRMEEIGRELAAIAAEMIAVEINEFGPPHYGKYLNGFVRSYGLLNELEDLMAGTRGLGLKPEELPGAVVDSFDTEVGWLLGAHGIN